MEAKQTYVAKFEAACPDARANRVSRVALRPSRFRVLRSVLGVIASCVASLVCSHLWGRASRSVSVVTHFLRFLVEFSAIQPKTFRWESKSPNFGRFWAREVGGRR